MDPQNPTPQTVKKVKKITQVSQGSNVGKTCHRLGKLTPRQN